MAAKSCHVANEMEDTVTGLQLKKKTFININVRKHGHLECLSSAWV